MNRLNGILPKWSLSVITVATVFLIPLAILLVNEWLVRDMLNMPVTEWIASFDKRFLLNYVIYLALFGVLYILPRKLYYTMSFLMTLVLLVFGIANRFKLELRSAPVTLDDFRLFREVTGFEFPVEINLGVLTAGVIFSVIVFALLLYMLPKKREWWGVKFIVCAASVLFFFALWTDRPFSPAQYAGLQKTLWKLEVGMKNNGMLANFVVIAKESEVKPPKGYSEQAIVQVVKRYPVADSTSNNKPNVIYIMSESFIDPYTFGDQHFQKDPVPNFRKYSDESIHGTMYSSEFGGGTANVEFEALTGFSMQFMRPDYVPYQLFLHQPIPALPSLFTQEGYEATAIHGYFAWFYQRNAVYKNLGFHQYISGEFMDLEKPNTPGGAFPTDKHMTDAILETLEYTSSPDFIHAVSTEAHMPYGRQQESEFVKSDALTDEVRPYLNDYVDKVHEADRELGRLLEALESQEEETIVVFWGDHLPSFPNGNELYGPLGTDLAEDWNGDYQDFLTMHSVPYFIWSSKGIEPKQQNISPNFLPTIITELTGIEGNAITAIGRTVMEEGNERIPFAQWPDQEQPQTAAMEDLQLIQHDWLHGERYMEELVGEVAIQEDFHLGLYDSLEIIESTVTETNYEWVLQGAPKYTKVVVNGKLTKSFGWQRLEPGLSKFTVPLDQLSKGDQIQFIVYNSRGGELMKSKTVELEK